jgi:hypothetical protein
MVMGLLLLLPAPPISAARRQKRQPVITNKGKNNTQGEAEAQTRTDSMKSLCCAA